MLNLHNEDRIPCWISVKNLITFWIFILKVAIRVESVYCNFHSALTYHDENLFPRWLRMRGMSFLLDFHLAQIFRLSCCFAPLCANFSSNPRRGFPSNPILVGSVPNTCEKMFKIRRMTPVGTLKFPVDWINAEWDHSCAQSSLKLQIYVITIDILAVKQKDTLGQLK